MQEQELPTPPQTPHSGKCWLIRRSPGCGCCPHEATYYGPWLDRKGADEYVEHTLKREADGHYKNRIFDVKEVPYEIAGRFIVLNECYATTQQFIDAEGSENYYKQLDDYEKLFSYL